VLIGQVVIFKTLPALVIALGVVSPIHIAACVGFEAAVGMSTLFGAFFDLQCFMSNNCYLLLVSADT
jgi:hypothetical protein